MRCNYITIEREYGSGGTKIARRLAEECGIACYGKEILQTVSDKYNIPIERIEKYEESVTNSFLYSVYAIGRVQCCNPDVAANEGHIFVAEQAVIKDLAANGKAIFLGHCASEALKDHKGVVHIFIRASKEEKKKRIIADYNIPESEVGTMIRRFDKKRANYYYANTAKKWSDINNYDIVLDSSQLGIDGCVNVLKGLL